MEEFDQALLLCAKPQRTQDRHDGERRIREIRLNDPMMFLYSCSQALNNHSIHEDARQLAGILFKNTVANSTKDEECEDLWFKMNQEQRDNLKDGLLEALGSNKDNIVRAAASCIAAVCVLEFPKNQWLDLLNTLCNNASHEVVNYRGASIITLGYICEELLPNEIKKEDSDIIISAFIESLDNNFEHDHLIEATIQGIYHSIKFTVDHFKADQGDLIISKILKATEFKRDNVREIAFQCIVEIVRLCYDYISPFMADISEVTMEAARNGITKVKTQAIEIWSSIAEEEFIREERNLSHCNIIDTALDMLLDMIQETIIDLNIGNEECDEDQEWGASTAAGCCLGLISLVAKDRVVDPITNFVAKSIRDNNWRFRYSGIVALGAILEGPSKQTLLEILSPAMPELVNLIDDENLRVRYAIFWLFSKIAKAIPELITPRDQFEMIYGKMMNGLKETPKIASNIASIISELADSLLNKREQLDTCILSEVYEELLNNLLEFILRTDIPNESDMTRVKVSGFSALYNLLQYAPCDAENTEIFGMLEKSVSPDAVFDTKTMELQGFFLCALQCAMTNVKCDIHEETGIKTIDLVLDIFRQRNDIFDEGFLVMSAVANKIPRALDRKVDDVAGFILYGLQSKNSAIVRNSCGVLSDLCTLVESRGIMEGFKQFMPILLELLKDKNVDRSIKIIVISLIGDTFLYTKSEFQPFFEETMQILESACMISIHQFNEKEDNLENLNHASTLHSAIVECYTCFVQNINEAGDQCYQTLGLYIYITKMLISFITKFS